MITKNQEAFEADALEALFSGFSEKKLRYAVLRNYENLPRCVGARDIDIIVHPRDLHDACNVVVALTRAKGLQYGNYYSDERLTQFALVGRDIEGGLQQIKIDLFVRSEVYGVEFLSAEEALHGMREHNGVPVVSNLVMLLDKWVFHLLTGQALNSKYDGAFSLVAKHETSAIIGVLARFLSKELASDLVSQLSSGEGSKIILANGERRRALGRLWARQGASALPRSCRFLMFRLRSSLRPKGPFLSISGPDGSGKTTLIEMVTTQLRAVYGENAVHLAHFRPSFLPRIAEVAQKARAVETVDENYDRPHRAKPSGLVGSFVRLGYYWVDYLAGYFHIVRPVLKRREVMLFDRYYFDMIADPLRSRVSLPMPILRVMGRLLPRPQYAFFIHVDPEKIYHRKQELTMGMIVQLNQRYGDLVRRGWLMPIDNNNAPQNAAAHIVDRIVHERHLKAVIKLK